MSLYGGMDVQIAKSELDNMSKLGSNFNFMSAQLMRKAAPKLTRATASPAAIASVKIDQSQIHPDEVFVKTDACEQLILNEYDPCKPNEYDKVHAAIQKKKREKKFEEENKKAKPLVSAYSDEPGDKLDLDGDLDFYEDPKDKKKDKVRAAGGGYAGTSDDYDGPSTSAKGGAMIAPPQSLISKDQESVNVLHPEVNQQTLLKDKGFVAPASNKRVLNMNNVSSVASNIMNKYGWKEGQGLGKEQQGMSSALIVEKTGRSRGVIVNESDERTKARIQLAKDEEARENAAKKVEDERKTKTDELTASLKQPSKVILLKNMVGPGEVDDDLEGETREECSKYGEVIQVIIYEIPSGVAPEEAVRIFVQFNRIESAIKAVVDLHNRFFGGRTVKCLFYPPEKFEALDLAP